MTGVYTQEQVSQFLDYIGMPSRYRLASDPPRDHAFLRSLHRHVISALPYENLYLHYGPHAGADLDPQHLFRKAVGEARGRGGYCMENSLLLLHMLRALGFRAYAVGVKIRYREGGVPKGPFVGWVHIAIIVTFEGEKEGEESTRYVVDVAFGGDGMTQPMRLEEGSCIRNMGTQDARLVRTFIPGQTELAPERMWWAYQYRNGSPAAGAAAGAESAEAEWNTFYVFSDAVEWSPADFEILNAFTGSDRSHQTSNVLVIKFLRRAVGGKEGKGEGEGEEEQGVEGGKEEDVEQEIYGKRMLVNGVVKENLGGKTRVVAECRTEEERVQALREWFGIRLTEEERNAIRGYRTELRG